MLLKERLIVGFGNPLRGDDGIGPKIISLLHDDKKNTDDCYDLGTDGLVLLDLLPAYKKAILIDAVRMEAEPGTICVFTPEEAQMHIQTDALSTHGFGLAEVLTLQKKLGINTTISIIGIEPKNIDFGNDLTDEIKTVIPKILNLIKSMTA